MFENMKLSGFLAAGVLAVTLAAGAASAATVEGQVDISGNVILAGTSFTSTGTVNLQSTGIVIKAEDDFAAYLTAFVTTATLTSFSFAATNQVIWSAGGFSFMETAFSDITSGVTSGFTATGVITGNGFTATVADMQFSTQKKGKTTVSFSSTTVPAPVPLPAAGFLLVGALGGLGALRRRKAKAA